MAYGLFMGTRPQTLYGLADSPIDLAAFMLDHGDGRGQPGLVQQVLEGRLQKPSDLTRDDILDNITLFWLTNTGVSSARLYWENKLPFFSVKGVTVPVGVSTFADEIYRVPRSWAEQAYPNLVSLQPARQGRALRGLGAAAAALRRRPRDVPIAALKMTLFERVHMPSFAGATEWLNSEPLGPAELRGHVVLVNFWTWTCINWLRQEPYVRAWSQAYRDDGLIVIGVHTPEFSFEHDIDGVRRATKERAIDYPVAVDNDYAIWSAFANHYWPALYFVDRDGIIRDHHFGEGRYETLGRVIQQLLGVEREPVSVEGLGVEAAADWDHLRTPETYLGYSRSDQFASAGRGVGRPSRLHAPGAAAPQPLGPCRRVDDQARARRPRAGRREHRLPVPRARRALVLSRGAPTPIPFRVLLDGEAPGRSHGVDIDENGHGVLRDGRMYQLVRQRDADRCGRGVGAAVAILVDVHTV